VNRSTSIWGADAKEFKPQRWLDEEEHKGRLRRYKAIAIIDFRRWSKDMFGERFCAAEFKVRESISCDKLDTDLVFNDSSFIGARAELYFELRDGADTQFEMEGWYCSGRKSLERTDVACHSAYVARNK